MFVSQSLSINEWIEEVISKLEKKLSKVVGRKSPFLALTTITRALKNKSVPEWENVLQELQRPSMKNFQGAAKSWWIPNIVSSFNSGLNTLKCQVQVMSRMTFWFLMILAIAFFSVKQLQDITCLEAANFYGSYTRRLSARYISFQAVAPHICSMSFTDWSMSLKGQKEKQ
ncbi:hypothetical protein WN944_007470 [Citrus x changshan-huyou]|uniref:NB-ARC domain-containing protein n=1 Tax=Citrus x changshan-huyou TaxID=2935761 RepID=A0AAP0MR86_9ROSI